MKSYSNLFEKLILSYNIDLAIRNASRGKKDRWDVNYCFWHRDELSEYLGILLIKELFYPKQHKEKVINDGITRKKRRIIKPDYVPEQIIHHAIVQVIGPIIYNSSYQYSCGSMPNRGGTHGKKYIEKYMRKHSEDCRYVLKLDIRHFFESIDHDILLDRCYKYFHDPKFNRLMERIIRVYHSSEGENKGLPIGYYTSQWLANWYLQDLDNYIKQTLRVGCYVRYMDDLVIFSSSKTRLHTIKTLVEKFLKNRLKLSINRKWQIFPLISRPLDFMGFKFYPNRTVLRKTILFRATRKAKKMHEVTWYNSSQMLSYLGWFKHCKVYNIYEKYIKPHIKPKQLRCCISKHSRRNSNAIIMVPKRKYCMPTGYRDVQRLCIAA